MKWDNNLLNLRNLLAGLYWNIEEARRIAIEVDLNPAFISFSSKSINTWTSILEEAYLHDKVKEIIKRAREQYPKVQSLALAEQNLLIMVQVPELKEETWQGPAGSEQIEKIIGTFSTLRPVSFLESGLLVSKSVGRVVLNDGSLGSGFLIDNDFLITNNHVIPSPDAAKGAIVEFNFQKTTQGLDAERESFKLIPENGFATSHEEEQGGDDWTAVRVDGNPNAKWGALPLTSVNPRVQDEVIIIQHPGGGPKQIALSHNVVVFVNDSRLQYLTDTAEGSSGSPVFDINWHVIALHHKGGWLREPGSSRNVYRNQGIHINAVINGLKKNKLL